MKTQISNNSAFTLIELLITILIFLIVMTVLLSSFNAFMISSKVVRENVQNSEKISSINKRIQLDFESVFIIHPPRYKIPAFNSDPDPYRFAGEEITLGQQVVSIIEFASTAHVQNGQNQRKGVARIAYYPRENDDETFNLYRADSLSPFPDDMESCSDPVLVKGLTGFEILYTDFEGREYKHWDSDDEEFSFTTPKSLKIKLTFGTREPRQTTIIPIGIINGRQPIE